jgi:hypothetical protein
MGGHPFPKIGQLNEEMDGIHFVNSLYWKRGEATTPEAKTEHERRKERLEEIRSELARLHCS